MCLEMNIQIYSIQNVNQKEKGRDHELLLFRIDGKILVSGS
jgi:hypothetical protein